MTIMTATTTCTRTFKVTRGWKHAGYTGGVEDGVIFVDGRRIGGTYWCGQLPRKTRWASYGPAGYLYGERGFPTREAAEAAQVREYATNPDEFDRLNDQADAELAAEQAERERAQEARWAAHAAEQQRKRLGDDEPGPTVATIPAYHVLYAPMAETTAVAEWLAANDVDDVSAVHPIRVERRTTRDVIVFEQPTAIAQLAAAMNRPSTHEGRIKAVETYAVTMTSPPPAHITDPPPGVDLNELFSTHWPAKFPLIDFGQSLACSGCTKAAGSRTTVVAWPCAPVAAVAV